MILLHGTGQRKDDWHALGRSLAGWGYGYLALDLRGHGESGKGPDGQPAPWRTFKPTKEQNEFANMTRDIEGAVAYLTGQGVLEEQIGIIGADVGSSVGVKYAAVHPKVPLIAILSPGTHYQEVLTINALRRYKPTDPNGLFLPTAIPPGDPGPGRLRPAGRGRAERHGHQGSPGARIKMLKGDLVRQIIDWLFPVRLPGNRNLFRHRPLPSLTPTPPTA